MPNTLDLEDDWGGVELAETLEQAFDIKFNRDEIENVDTVGELFDIVIRDVTRLPDVNKCASAMTFYRLRRALLQLQPDARLIPSTSIAGFGELSVKQLFRKLRELTSLNTPRPSATWVSYTGVVFFLSGFLLIPPLVIVLPKHSLMPVLAYIAPACILLGIGIARFDPGRLPQDCGSLGGLAVRMSALSYGKMIKLGARADDTTLWAVFTDLLTEHSSLPKDKIQRDTVFFKSQLKPA